MATWQCIQNCGACCHLDPSDRPDLAEYLTPIQLEQYLSMVGIDGWCINFDQVTRACKIYADRPRFCRVESEIFSEMFGITAEELNDFAIDCCREQIMDRYGDYSLESIRFEQAIGSSSIISTNNPY
ncbi:putative Fe-S oxidoreductase [Synechococcus sp. PCC 7502]|uniref:YkgJ family cysteine cluster protein n=1 Tax=Synechococcus sp. PCC 7502 TaxID=1173263 RepID=UPI00029FF27A|nr:YkgJ family cysteine cluster protein [Synechococcus sp. PCC 7502]AFY74325.1 putative Fe-S oxidoreductase [Synechococcus sp. PCC 7502]